MVSHTSRNDQHLLIKQKLEIGGEHMAKRKFISFTNKELDILVDALMEYGNKELLKQANDEIRERKYAKKDMRNGQKQSQPFMLVNSVNQLSKWRLYLWQKFLWQMIRLSKERVS